MALKRRDFMKAVSCAGAAAFLPEACCPADETSTQARRSVMGLQTPLLCTTGLYVS